MLKINYFILYKRIASQKIVIFDENKDMDSNQILFYMRKLNRRLIKKINIKFNNYKLI